MTTVTARNQIDILKDNGQDFEWYPTTDEMIDAVLHYIPVDADSIMDVGAGDGRVLLEFGRKCKDASLFSIEKSLILVQTQDPRIVPVGTDFWEQNLAALASQYIFCNPPYSEYEAWTERIISEGFAKQAFFVIPQRWKDSQLIADALERREATARSIYQGDFLAADRASRAKIDIVQVKYKGYDNYRRDWKETVADPFDQWFDANIDMFDRTREETNPDERTNDKDKLGIKLRGSDVDEMVDSYLADYNHLESNYRMIFELDGDLLRELGVSKSSVREGLKKKMRNLKIVYWSVLFERLDAISSRLTTKSREKLLSKLVANNTIDFTAPNIRAIALWAINNVNSYLDDQLVELFKDLATFEGATNYKSNQKTWVRHYWRYNVEDHDHFKLDYRIVVCKSQAMYDGGYDKYQHPGNLHNSCHDLNADMIAVFANLGFKVFGPHSKSRDWKRGQWQNFRDLDGTTIFQVKAYLNGNVHIRVYPKAMQALNIKAAQLLKWVGSIEEIVDEMGYDKPTAKKYFEWSQYISVRNLPLLQSSEPESPQLEEPDKEYELTEDGQVRMF